MSNRSLALAIWFQKRKETIYKNNEHTMFDGKKIHLNTTISLYYQQNLEFTVYNLYLNTTIQITIE
jgi:hypothetical protein